MVLRDVGQPELIRGIGWNSCLVFPSASTTAHRSSWTGGPGFFPFLARPLPKAENQALVEHNRHAVRTAMGWPLASAFRFSEVPVSELRVITVGIKEGVGPIRLGDIGFGNRCFQPPVVGLAGELQNPARHRNGDSVGGELSHERVEPFDGRFACDRYAAARRRTSFSCSSRRVRRRSSRSSVDSSVCVAGFVAGIDLGLADPFGDGGFVDAEVLGDLGNCCVLVAAHHDADDVIAEFLSG